MNEKSKKQISSLKKGYKQVMVNLDWLDYEQVQREAKAEHRTLSNFIRHIIAIYLNQKRAWERQKQLK